jgi:hypothetical protein
MSHEQNRDLVRALSECVAECNHCAVACLNEKDVSMLSRCIQLDIDCAAICELAIGYVSRGAVHAENILHVCGDICAACAEECEKHSHMDHCKKCAEVCRKCAELCHAGVAA